MTGRIDRHPLAARVSIGAAILVVLGAAAVLVLHMRASQARASSIQTLLLHADHEIGLGFYRIASQDVRNASSLARTRSAWLAVSKRALEIGRASKNFRLLRDVARNAVASLPGSEELWAIRVYAEIQSGNYGEAYRMARSRLTSSRYESLKAEALLRSYPDLNPSETPTGKEGALVQTILSRDPVLFESLGRELGNNELVFDAALLLAWRGEMDQAYSLLVGLQSVDHPAAGMLVSYDANHLDTALNYYSSLAGTGRSPELSLLADDILVMQSEYDKAAAGYQALIQSDPGFAWTPYVDLAWLVTSGKTKLVAPGVVLGLLHSALGLFPHEATVVLAYARLSERLGQTNAAAEALSRFLSSSPGNLDASLLQAELQGTGVNPARLESTLWELFYRANGGEQARVARYLGWYLLGVHDFAGLDQIFAQYRQSKGDEWIPFYRGIKDGMNGDYAAGVVEFQRAYAVTPRWQTLYNMGVLELKAGNSPLAEQDFQKADSSFTLAGESNARNPLRAVILAGIAEALAADGNIAGARRELNYALDVDPGSLRVHLLLQKLDSSPQK